MRPEPRPSGIAPPRAGRLIVLAFVSLPPIGLALHALGYRRTRALLARLAGPPRAVPDETAVEHARAALVEIDRAARRLPGRPGCLTRALALWWLLARRGIDSEIEFGAEPRPGRLDAHAWVSCRGRILGDEGWGRGVLKRASDTGAGG